MSSKSLVIIIAALVVGAGVGVYVGWVAAPVQYTDTEPASLQPAYKDDYILMIATAYAGDGNLAAAQDQLAALGLTDPAAAVGAAAERLAQAGLPEIDQQRLEALRTALDPGATSSVPASEEPLSTAP